MLIKIEFLKVKFSTLNTSYLCKINGSRVELPKKETRAMKSFLSRSFAEGYAKIEYRISTPTKRGYTFFVIDPWKTTEKELRGKGVTLYSIRVLKKWAREYVFRTTGQ